MNELTLLDNFRIHNFLRCLEEDNEYSNLFRINDYLDKKLLAETVEEITDYLLSEDCKVERISAFYAERYHLFLRVKKKYVEGAIDYFYVLSRGETIRLLALNNDDDIVSIYDSNFPEENVDLFKSSSVLTYNDDEDESELKVALKNNIDFNNVMDNVVHFREISYKKYLSLLEHFCKDEEYLSSLAPIRKRFLFKTLEDGSSSLFYDFITGKAVREDFASGIQRHDLLTYRIKNFDEVENENNFLLLKNENKIIAGDGIIEENAGMIREAPDMSKIKLKVKSFMKGKKKERKNMLASFRDIDAENEEEIVKWISGEFIPFCFNTTVNYMMINSAFWGMALMPTYLITPTLFVKLYLIITAHALGLKSATYIGYRYFLKNILKTMDKELWDPLLEKFKDDEKKKEFLGKIKERTVGFYKGIEERYYSDEELVGETYLYEEELNGEELVTVEYAESYIDSLMDDITELFGEAYNEDHLSKKEINGLLMNETMYGESVLGDFKNQLRKIKRTTTKVPKKIFTQLKRFKTKAEHLISNHRKNKREKLKEKLINDEIIPFLDELLEWFVSLAVGYGVYAVVFINPILSIIFGVLSATVIKVKMHKRTVERKELAIQILKDEIDMLEENIQDARNENDRKARDTMKRMKKKLERQVDRIRYENRLQ